MGAVTKLTTRARLIGLMAALCALPALVEACLAPTQVTLVLKTDVPCAELTGVSVTIGSGDETETKPAATVTTSCAASGAVGSIVLVPSSSDREAEFTVKVVAGRNTPVDGCVAPAYGKDLPSDPAAPMAKGCIVARRSLRFIDHEPLTLAIDLRGSCLGEPCTPGNTCAAGGCVPASIGDPKACASGDGCSEKDLSGARKVFVTSALYSGNLGGLAGADEKCQALAIAAGLSGRYMAWLSTKAESPTTRFVHTGGPFVRTDGTVIAGDWTDLVDGTLSAPIHITERGEPAPDNNPQFGLPWPVMSTTLEDGTYWTHQSAASTTCEDFTSELGTLDTGDSSATDAKWSAASTNYSADACKTLVALYCFQQ